jgi:hypothetical protein
MLPIPHAARRTVRALHFVAQHTCFPLRITWLACDGIACRRDSSDAVTAEALEFAALTDVSLDTFVEIRANGRCALLTASGESRSYE